MNTDSSTLAPTARLLAPRQGAIIRTLFEAGLVYGLLTVLASLLRSDGSVLEDVASFLGFVWLIVWSAWRLRPIERRRWWARGSLGLLRAVAVGALLVVIVSAFAVLAKRGNLTWDGRLVVLVWFLVLRTAVTGGAVVARRVRRRFRWQLIVSHAGIIVLMFVILTSTGSVLAVVFATHYLASHPIDMAASVRDDLQLARAVSPIDPGRADEVFRLIYARRLPLRGGSPLISFVRSPLLPSTLGLVTPEGHVLQGRVLLGQDGKKTRRASSFADLVHLSPSSRERLRRKASSARVAEELVPGANPPEGVAIMPIRRTNGTIEAFLVLRVTDFQPTQQQFFRVLVAIFGVTTVFLILITSIPLLGLSFLFSYLVARGLTRRLESLSGVATSIASGELHDRAPITTRNEVGQLATDLNRMADHLQTTIHELEEARAQSEEALRLRQELVANISHELRTPLAIMRAQLETVSMHNAVLSGAPTSGTRGDVTVSAVALEALETETDRLSALVDDLFALSRVQGGAIEMRLEPIDVTALAEEIAGLMGPLAQREGRIVLSAEILHRPLWAMVDSIKLQQILANLIRNAVRHTPDGGIIIISVSREAEWVLVSVADTGEGIAAAHLPQIFDRFYRADPARSRATGGAGLGLAIVREFVELMGGRVEVQSTLGEGTRFHVFLPAASQPS